MGKEAKNNATKVNTKTSFLEAVGNRIRNLQEKNGMTQEQLAEKIGSNCATNTVYRYENGLVEIKASRIVRLCEIFGVTPSYLLLGEDDCSENMEEMIYLFSQLNKEDQSTMKRIMRAFLNERQAQENLT